MPQMAPLSWLLLFFFFIGVYMIFNIVNYFTYQPFTPSSTTQQGKKGHSLDWKW
uniref:ATP synthase complex subunit 8 n=1 Tax=Torleya mikhaili TaxID=2816379 RepID=A0A899IKN0_9INSE|nr:ATP synthase F0 subunit 8 [Torleya mikhaili]QSL98494.1 ATP synthase F0 subunit 8 [Torleya mikhaili]